MKRKMIVGTLVLACCGCSSMNHTESGLLGGGLIGGALGALVGAAVHNPGAGAAIGAAAGAGLGGLAGASEDRAEKREEIRQTAAISAAQEAAKRAPRLDEIVSMTKNGVPESNIINEIRNCGAIYNLTSDDIIYLSSNGVSSNVITELQCRGPRAAIYATPGPAVIYRQPVYVYDPYPPPFAVGIGYHGGCRRW